MKNIFKPYSIYAINEFIDIKKHSIFLLLEKYFIYHEDYDYTVKTNQTIIFFNKELSEDPELLDLLKKCKFKKVD